MADDAPVRSSVSIALKADMLRSDLEIGHVWFINYAALDPTSVKAEDLDLHGAGMLPADVEQFAHLWLAHSRSVDVNHDGVGRPVFTMESFFNGPDIASPAWPINAHAVRMDVSQSDEVLEGLRTGDLNSVSLDAYTFNRVVRLPVAEAKSLLGIHEVLNQAPGTLPEWALELAQRGYSGVLGVAEVRPGLYVAQRSHGLPLAITYKDGGIEAASGGGAWGRVALALCEAGSLVRLSGTVASPIATERAVEPIPTGNIGSGSAGNGPIDHRRWDRAEADDMLRAAGLLVGVPLVDQVEVEGREKLEREMFAALLDDTVGVEPSQQAQEMVLHGVSLRSYPHGLIPHHTVHDGELMVSKEAVLRGMSQVHLLPSGLQSEARRHLLGHIREVSAVDPELAGSLGNGAPSGTERSGTSPNGVVIGDDFALGGVQ